MIHVGIYRYICINLYGYRNLIDYFSIDFDRNWVKEWNQSSWCPAEGVDPITSKCNRSRRDCHRSSRFIKIRLRELEFSMSCPRPQLYMSLVQTPVILVPCFFLTLLTSSTNRYFSLNRRLFLNYYVCGLIKLAIDQNSWSIYVR